MFIHYLRCSCLTFVLLIFTSASFADIYKWVDADGQTHYGQQAPRDQQSTLIKAPPPPAINPVVAQKPVNTLIEQQAQATKEKQERLEKAKEELEKEAVRKENCRISQHNLQQTQNNPGRRVKNEDGTVTRPSENERQNKITQLQQYIKANCF